MAQKDNNKQNNPAEKQLIGYINTGTVTNWWINGKAGYFEDFDSNCLYRFCETDENCNACLLIRDEQKNLPVLACGFAGWFIKQWQQKDKQQIIEKYIDNRLNEYRAKLAADPNGDLIANPEYEFYSTYEQIENKYLKTSEAIYEYLSDEEVNIIKGFIERFKRYLNDKITSSQSTVLSNSRNDNTRSISFPQPEAAEQPKSNTNKENTGKPQPTIDAERLKLYFNSGFKGMGNNINYFDWLINHLKTERTPKAFAQIALMIHNSSRLNMTKPNTFKGWYKIFCECVGCEQKTYKPKDLKPYPKTLTDTFNYL